MDNFHINGPYDFRNLAFNQQQSTEGIGMTAWTDWPTSFLFNRYEWFFPGGNGSWGV